QTLPVSCEGSDLWIPYNLGADVNESAHIVLGCRMRTPLIGEGEVCLARREQHRWQGVVSFDAARLVIDAILLVALPGELLFDGPGPRPNCRVFDGDLIGERVRAGPRPALDEVQVLARALIVNLRAEVCHIDDERITLP